MSEMHHYVVEIMDWRHSETDAPSKTIDCGITTYGQAEKVERGVNINLNENFYTRINVKQSA